MSRPLNQPIDASAFIAEMGDAVVDANTLAELDDLQRRSGEPDESNMSVEALAARSTRPAKSQQVAFEGEQEPDEDGSDDFGNDEPAEPAKAPAQADPLEEQRKILLAQNDAQLQAWQESASRAFEKTLSQMQPPPKPVQQEPDPALSNPYLQVTAAQLAELDKTDPFQASYVRLHQQQYQMQRQNAALHSELQAIRTNEKQREDARLTAAIDGEVAQLKEKFGAEVVSKYLTEAEIAQVRQAAIQSRNTNVAQALKPVLLARYAEQELIGKKDELAVKRDEKRQQSIRAASSVAGGGGVFQQPVQVSKDRTIGAGKKDMLAELRAAGIK